MNTRRERELEQQLKNMKNVSAQKSLLRFRRRRRRRSVLRKLFSESQRRRRPRLCSRRRRSGSGITHFSSHTVE